MSKIFIQDWDTQNENRNYPLQDGVSREDSTGDALPQNIIANLQISVPATLSANVHVSAVSLTSALATVTIAATASSIPILAITVPKPVVVGKHYQFNPMQDGVGGWVVFGSGVNLTNKYYYFDNYLNSLLESKTVHPYDTLPVTNIHKDGVSPLTGLVLLRGGNDIEVVGEDRNINDELTRCIIVRLSKTKVPPENLDTYVGPCGKRPEANNCAGTPITNINGVTPDCNGNITFEVVGGDAQFIADNAYPDTIILQTPIVQTDVCAPEILPDVLGCLPDEECSSIPIIEPSSSGEESSSVTVESDCSSVPDLSIIGETYSADFFSMSESDIFDVFALTEPVSAWTKTTYLHGDTEQGVYAALATPCILSSEDTVFRLDFTPSASVKKVAILHGGIDFFDSTYAPAYISAGVDFHSKKPYISYNNIFGGEIILATPLDPLSWIQYASGQFHLFSFVTVTGNIASFSLFLFDTISHTFTSGVLGDVSHRPVLEYDVNIVSSYYQNGNPGFVIREGICDFEGFTAYAVNPSDPFSTIPTV